MSAFDFSELDHVATLTDFLAVWDYVDGLGDHYDPDKQPSLEEFVADALRSSKQAEEYIKLVPSRAERTRTEHNAKLAEIVNREWRKLGFKRCSNCSRLFVPQMAKHEHCGGCHEMFLEVGSL